MLRRRRRTSGVTPIIAAALVLGACAATTVESGAPAGVIGSTPPPAESGATTTSSPVAPTATSVPVTAAAPATTSTVPPPTVVPLTGWEAVDQYLRVTVVRGGSDAVSFAVTRDGALLHAAAFGERSADDPIDIQDRFRIASISKTIAAVTVLQLVEAGLVGLDDPVGALVATRLGVATPVAGVTDITVRQLLTHRSGFGQYENLFFANQVGSCDEAAVVGITTPMRDVPGASFQYSNLNFCMLGILVEQLTGRSYVDVVDEQLLAPLDISGMRLAGTFDVGADDVEHASEPGRNYMEVLGAAGAWIATPTALTAILNSLDPTTPGWKPLDASTLEVMKTVTTDPIVVDAATGLAPVATPVPVVPETGYGMGLMIFGPDSYGHTGTVESTHAMFAQRPDGIGWAITVSGDYPSSTRQLARIMENALLFGGFTDGSYAAAPPPIDGA